MSYITTFTGIKINPKEPNINDIQIKDIAHSLSLICRGNGHVSTFFSVAQHCINCALEAKERHYNYKIILACLLHDAAESYLSDVPRPLKEDIKDYVNIENKLLDIIYTKYLGSPLTLEEQTIIKDIDDDMLYYDLKYLLNETLPIDEPTIHITLNYDFIPFSEIEKTYLELFNTYSK